MAPTHIFAFFLCVSLCSRASFSLPIALDVKTVQSNSEIVLTEKSVLNAETILNIDEETKLVQSLTTTETVFNAFENVVKADHGKRIKRDIFNALVHCPDDRIPFGNRCLMKEQFEQYNEVSDGDDYEAER